MEKIRIKKENIPSYTMIALAQTVTDCVQNFFADPEHRAEFDNWLKARDEMKEREPEC